MRDHARPIDRRSRSDARAPRPPRARQRTRLWSARRYKLNVWDVGGQSSLRSYWRNYYEQTEGLIWVVDSTDARRLDDCKRELHKLLREERLTGATLLIFANKQDISGALPSDKLLEVSTAPAPHAMRDPTARSDALRFSHARASLGAMAADPRSRPDGATALAHRVVQRRRRGGASRGTPLDRRGHRQANLHVRLG